MPFLKNYYPMRKVVSNAEEKMDSLRNFYGKTIREHQESFNPNNIKDHYWSLSDYDLNLNEDINIQGYTFTFTYSLSQSFVSAPLNNAHI